MEGLIKVSKELGCNVDELMEFAISTCDGHEEEWSYFMTEDEARKGFESLKETEDDIHLYKLNPEQGYEVIDSFWIE